MEKLKMQTPNLVDKYVEQIAKIFPEVITEIKNENGDIIKGIDFDLLKQKLSNVLVEDENERYRLDWPGKKASMLKANLPLNKTLRPIVTKSVNFEITKNLYIEGENFEVLKLIQESYLEKIKLIYIDPPYNTGNDFIYIDNYSEKRKEHDLRIGAIDEDGGRYFRNTESEGRFHSNWLSMMYERLTIARDLLTLDGIIFISIGDNEVHNLRYICDQIFGESNLAGIIHRRKNRKPHNAGHTMSLSYEFILVYYREKSFKLRQEFDEMQEDEKGSYTIYPILQGDKKKRTYTFLKGIRCDCVDLKAGIIKAKNNDKLDIEILDKPVIANGKLLNDIRISGRFRLTDEEGKLSKAMLEDNIFINKAGFPKEKRYRSESDFKVDNHHWDIDGGKNEDGNEEIKTLFNLKGDNYIFPYPKPVALIEKIISTIDSRDYTVLDFFGGSSSTAHAVLKMNALDQGNRKFIIVQYPEPIQIDSQAFKDGFKYISDIGTKRIEKASELIRRELGEKYSQEMQKLTDNCANIFSDEDYLLERDEIQTRINYLYKMDVGFRFLKVDSSNMKDVYYHPTEITQDILFASNIKEDRTPEDLLTQVILDLGLELSLPIEKKDIFGYTIFFVQTNALVACFDENIDLRIVDEIAKLNPFKVVFKDSGFINDKDRINVEERFKRLSPQTVVKVI